MFDHTTNALENPLRELGREIIEINKANGWNVTKPADWDETPYKIPAVLMLLASEVSEALEAYRKDDLCNFVEELADVQIRLLDLATGLGIDLDYAVKAKLVKNRQRGHRHGGKKL